MTSARIYKPSKTAMQSGAAKTKDWVLEFEPSEPRTIDPLMGYTSSGDTRTQVRLSFHTKEEAIAYAEKNGIPFTLFDEQPKVKPKIAYSDNFKWGRIGQWTH